MSDTEFDIEHLCREMAMSRTLFFGRLKSVTGKAPQEFIRILKLEHAAELLKQKNISNGSRGVDRICQHQVFQHCVQEIFRGVTKQILW